MSYGSSLRRCVRCGRRFYSDCAEICQLCFERELEQERRVVFCERMKGFRLAIELVPEPLWYKSLCSVMSRVDWDKLRYGVYRAGGFRCEVCGAGGSLYCHEVWLYDDVKHVQKLVAFQALCESCNHVKHIGLAGIKLDKRGYNKVIRHFKQVNGCSYEDFLLARDIAFEVWEARSEFEWSQDLGKYAELVEVKGG